MTRCVTGSTSQQRIQLPDLVAFCISSTCDISRTRSATAFAVLISVTHANNGRDSAEGGQAGA